MIGEMGMFGRAAPTQASPFHIPLRHFYIVNEKTAGCSVSKANGGFYYQAESL